MSLEFLDSIEIKFSSNPDAPSEFSGHASIFGNRDRVGDVVEPGAFAKSLAEHAAAGTKPALLWSHDPRDVIGVIEDIFEDEKGLFVKGRFALGTQRGREIQALARMGAACGLSIGYRDRGGAIRKNGVRVLRDVELFEISVTGSGLAANPAAKVESVKSAAADQPGGSKMELENDGAAPDTAAVEAIVAEAVKGIADELKDTKARLTAAETKLARPHIQTKAVDVPDIETKAFAAFLRGGIESIGADERKSLQIGSDPSGGYIAPPTFIAEVLKGVVQFSPVRQAARVGVASGPSVQLPKRTGTPTAYWVSENENRTETASSYGLVDIPIHEAAAYVDVSLRLLEDSAIDVAAEVAYDLAEEYGRLEGAAFVNGTGVKQPFGVLSDTTITSVPSGSSSALTLDGVISLFYALPPAYRSRAVWMANGSTIAALRKIKDGEGRPIWAAPLQAGQPETLLGRPVIEATDFPNIAGGATPLLFGDFSTGYRIFDKPTGFEVIRDPFTQRANGKVRFHSRMRTGGGVVLADALRRQSVAAS